MIDLTAHLTALRRWSSATFGFFRSLEYNCRHIESELIEVRSNPTDVTEWIDIAILAFDGAMRAGHPPEAVACAFVNKLAVIYERKYVKRSDGLMVHVKCHCAKEHPLPTWHCPVHGQVTVPMD